MQGWGFIQHFFRPRWGELSHPLPAIAELDRLYSRWYRGPEISNVPVRIPDCLLTLRAHMGKIGSRRQILSASGKLPSFPASVGLSAAPTIGCSLSKSLPRWPSAPAKGWPFHFASRQSDFEPQSHILKLASLNRPNRFFTESAPRQLSFEMPRFVFGVVRGRSE